MKIRSGIFRRVALLAALAALLLSLSTGALAESPCVSQVYKDVPPVGHWAHEGIDYCIYNGLLNGVNATEFDPDGATTRVQFVTILYRLAGSPDFPYQGRFLDISKDKWFSSAVEWAAENRIATGVSKKYFAPDEIITLEQMVLMLYRYCGCPETRGDLNGYADAGDIHSYAVEAMTWAVENGIIGDSGSAEGRRLNAQSNASRAQIAASTMRVGKMVHNTIPDNGAAIGHLEHEDQVEWYTFNMAEEGAVYLAFEGLQQGPDGARYHWNMVLYDVDRQTVMEDLQICGYSNGGSRVEYVGYPSLDAGIYHIRVSRAVSGEPGQAAFTRDPFRIYRNTVYFSATGVYADKSLPTFSEAGQIVYNTGRTFFVKKNNGEAIAAFCENSMGVEVPVLVGKDEDAVAMVMFTESGVSDLQDSIKGQVGGVDYYCTSADHIQGYASENEKKPYYTIKDCGKVSEQTITKALNKATENQRNWLVINLVAAAGLILLGFLVIKLVTNGRPLPERVFRPRGEGREGGIPEPPLFTLDGDLLELKDLRDANNQALDHMYQLLASDYFDPEPDDGAGHKR